MREIWKLPLFRTLWFVIQLSFKIFQALTSFALLYQYTDPSGKFGKHSKTFRDHVNFPVAITKQHNWQPISYVAQTKHTNFIFSKVNPNALKNQAIRSYTATTATDTSSLVSYAQKEEGVCEVLCNISDKDFFWTQKIQYIPRQFWIISGPLNFKDRKKIANNFFKRLLQYVSIISLLLSEALEPLLFGEERT